MIVLSVCLPSDSLSQRLLSYLGFSYLGYEVALHGCSSKVQMLLLALDVGVNSSSNNAREVSTHGHHQMVDTEIRLIIFLQPKMEKLYTVSKNKTGS